MDAQKATDLVNGLISDVDAVRRDRAKFDAWRLKCSSVLDRILGPGSKHLKQLRAVSFRFTGMSNLGDNRPHIEAFDRGLTKSQEVLRAIIWEIEQFGIPVETTADDPERAMIAVELICNRFHAVVRQLRQRHESRPTLDVSDEYDVQDLLHALLRLYFDDVRPEEWTPSYAGKCSRMDFLLKSERIVIEVKKTRPGLDAKKLGEELIIDCARYKSSPDCKTLVCFVYDPDARIVNAAGIENDLTRQEDGFVVKVVITPTH
jgi:hypothetical protein